MTHNNDKDCTGCPHHRPTETDDCAAGAHNADHTCTFEMLSEDFEKFREWRIASLITPGLYYTEDEAADRVHDIEKLREYLYGLDDAVVDGMYKKEYVDTFSNR